MMTCGMKLAMAVTVALTVSYTMLCFHVYSIYLIHYIKPNALLNIMYRIFVMSVLNVRLCDMAVINGSLEVDFLYLFSGTLIVGLKNTLQTVIQTSRTW